MGVHPDRSAEGRPGRWTTDGPGSQGSRLAIQTPHALNEQPAVTVEQWGHPRHRDQSNLRGPTELFGRSRPGPAQSTGQRRPNHPPTLPTCWLVVLPTSRGTSRTSPRRTASPHPIRCTRCRAVSMPRLCSAFRWARACRGRFDCQVWSMIGKFPPIGRRTFSPGRIDWRDHAHLSPGPPAQFGSEAVTWTTGGPPPKEPRR